MSPRRETEKQRLARYAAKDVVDKLAVRPGDAVGAAGTRDLGLLRRVRVKAGRPAARAGEPADVILYWPATPDTITADLRGLKRRMTEAGGIWVISAKRGRERRGRPYLGNDVIALGLAAGLVDNKVCSISETETAIRFVVRRSDRRA